MDSQDFLTLGTIFKTDLSEKCAILKNKYYISSEICEALNGNMFKFQLNDDMTIHPTRFYISKVIKFNKALMPLMFNEHNFQYALACLLLVEVNVIINE